MDVVWSCASTLCICLWAQLHLNVPGPKEKLITRFWRRLRWLILGALVPETLLLMAGGQWASARRSRADMQALHHAARDRGTCHWTIVHGFHADSGGFVLRSPDTPDFPVSAKQIHYLVERNYIAMPSISKDEIMDKSNGDIFTKSLACLQTIWFLFQITARLVAKQHVSPLEIQAGAIILCTVNTYLMWLHKPLDVNHPTVLVTETPMARILKEAGPDAMQHYRYTPLDFVEPHAHILAIWPRFCPEDTGAYKGPISRIPNDQNPRLDTLLLRAYFGFVVICFSTSSFIEWYFPFPSGAEKIVWRVCCVTAEASLFVHAVAEAIGNRRLRDGTMTYSYMEGYKLNWPFGALLFWIPFVLYTLARTVIVGVSISSLRGLPADCYTTISWLKAVPHIS